MKGLNQFLVTNLILCSNYCWADAWNIPEGKSYLKNATMVNPLSTHKFSGDVQIAEELEHRIIEGEYGIRNDLSMQGKLIVTNYKTTLHINDLLTKKSRFTTFSPYLHLKKQLAKNDNKVLSIKLAYFAHPLNMRIKPIGVDSKLAAYLLHGISYDKHYLDLQMGFTVNNKFKEVAGNIELKFGYKLKDNLEMSIGYLGFYNHLYTFTNKPPMGLIDYVIDHSHLPQYKQDEIRSDVLAIANQVAHVNTHLLNFKVAYRFKKDKELGIEFYTNVADDRSFKNNSVLLSVTKYF